MNAKDHEQARKWVAQIKENFFKKGEINKTACVQAKEGLRALAEAHPGDLGLLLMYEDLLAYAKGRKHGTLR